MKNWEDDEFDTHPEIVEYLKRNDFLNEKIEYEIDGWDEMEKEFVPYDIAFALKGLGFDETCLARYIHEKLELGKANNLPSVFYVSLAPLYQQAFRWFREKYHLNGLINYKNNIKKWDFIPYDMNLDGLKYGKYYWKYVREHKGRKFDTREEAQNECLKELIELVKHEQV